MDKTINLIFERPFFLSAYNVFILNSTYLPNNRQYTHKPPEFLLYTSSDGGYLAFSYDQMNARYLTQQI